MAFSCRDRAGQHLSGEMPKIRAAISGPAPKSMDGLTGSAQSRLQRPLGKNAASGMPACKMRVRLTLGGVPHDVLLSHTWADKNPFAPAGTSRSAATATNASSI